MQKYWPAKICKKGHVIDYGNNVDSNNCYQCGSMVITKCDNCNNQINGSKMEIDFFDVLYEANKSTMAFPFYCHSCGKPYPWTQNILNNAIEIIALDTKVDEATKTIIKNAIPDLLVDTFDTPLAATKYSINIKKFSEPVSNALYQLLVDVLATSAKSILFPVE